MVAITQNTVISTAISGDYRIDVLLEDTGSRWNWASPVGTPIEVTYSFMSAAPVYASDGNKVGFMTFTAEQKAAARQIFSEIQAQFNITFKEVSDNAYSYGQIRLGNNSQGTISAAYAYVPEASGDLNGGDIYVNRDDYSNLSSITPGTYAYATLVHEIGHALGLKHPGNYNAGSAASTEPGNYLAAAEDTEAHTVMSYTGVAQGQNRTFYGTYDILTLQYLYGARTYHAGNDTYAFTNADGQALKVINDSSGIDTIDVSAVTVGAKISLQEGALSSIGKLANGYTAAVDNISIAYAASIENVVGTAYADKIIGNTRDNLFRLGSGNDYVDGDLGYDTLVYSAARSKFAISRAGSSVIVTDKAGSEGMDTLLDIERIKFADSVVVFDGAGAPGQMYRLYQAAFNRAPDLGGLGAWINFLEHGATLQDAAAGFLDSLEFKIRYGENWTIEEFVTRLYNNVLHRAPEKAGFDGWVYALAVGAITPTLALTGFSESEESQIALMGVIETGIEFIPFVG